MRSPDPIKIRHNIRLAPLTTLKVGGPARFFVKAESEDDILAAFERARRDAVDTFVLGGGSNVLISDRGFDGLVIQVGLRGIEERSGVVIAMSGEDWDELVAFSVERDLAGLECLSGIPGSVGGTPVQNVGAYGQEVSETIVSVRCFDRESGEIRELDNRDCGFTYRTSIFNSTERGRYVVLAVTYRLVANGTAKIAYKDLREYFGEHTPTLAETREAVLKIRRAKSMVIDALDPNSRSAGSFFKNPIVDVPTFELVMGKADGGQVPNFPAGGGSVKIPAAWLIERSGFQKGFRLGNVGISTNHSLALVNLGGASADEIIALKEKIQDGVRRKFGILLQPEPVFVGFE